MDCAALGSNLPRCVADSFDCGCWLMASATSRCDTSALWSLWYSIGMVRRPSRFPAQRLSEPVDDFESAEGRSGPRGLLRCDRLSPWKPPRSAVM